MTPTIEPTSKQVGWLWTAVGVFLFMLLAGGGGYYVYTQYKQRGIRNNNPGNIKFNPNITWRGQIGQDGPYLIFDTPENGLRALAMDLKNKMARGLNTVQKIITVWAPPKENDTPAYIAAVSSQMGVTAAQPLGKSNLPAMVKAITQHENGVQPYPDALIAKAISLV